MNSGAAIANSAWWLACLPEWLRFRRATDQPEAVQRRLLRHYIEHNAATEFGRQHDFTRLRGWEDFSASVPIRTYDEFQPWIEKIADGEAGVLTRERVDLLEPSSGSSGPEKWIPYTATLKAEYRRGVAAWMAQNFSEQPTLLGGRSYWSLTPQPPRAERRATRVPVGFDDDSAYLGGLARRFVDLTLIANPALKHVDDMDEFWHVTLLMLLGRRDLSLVSVWHPSYLLLLVENLRDRWSSLIADLDSGYEGSTPALRKAPDRNRARQLAELDPGDIRAIWPGLRVISCWGDAHAGAAVTELQRCFPGVTVQPKGLIATEAFVTLPFAGSRPLAIRSHFFEFLDDHGDAHPGWSLRQGESYSLVITTGGGLYRYRLRDRVEVTGFLGATPSLRFVGKEDNVSDHFGEKLDEGFVAHCLATVFEAFDLAPRFAMLALEQGGPGYALYLEAPGVDTQKLAGRLEQELCRNPHYELCVRLGQLRPVRVVEVPIDAYQAYTDHLREQGVRLGDIKPSPLSRYCDWSTVFP